MNLPACSVDLTMATPLPLKALRIQEPSGCAFSVHGWLVPHYRHRPVDLVHAIETNNIGSWYHISFTVNDFVVDVGQVFSICCDCMFFLDEANTCWLACSRDLITCNFFSSFIASYSFQSSWLVSNLPLKIEFLGIGTFLVGTAITSLFFV